jgi:hypothetical protein
VIVGGRDQSGPRPKSNKFYLHGVKRNHLAKIWGSHPAKIGRDAAGALDKIRRLTVRYIKLLDPPIELQFAVRERGGLFACREKGIRIEMRPGLRLMGRLPGDLRAACGFATRDGCKDE